MAEPNRVPLTVRLRPDDKDVLVSAAEQASLEVGIAARMVLDIVVRRLRSGDSFLKVLGDLERDPLDVSLQKSFETVEMVEALRRQVEAMAAAWSAEVEAKEPLTTRKRA